jgi:hypothetical protein
MHSVGYRRHGLEVYTGVYALSALVKQTVYTSRMSQFGTTPLSMRRARKPSPGVDLFLVPVPR